MTLPPFPPTFVFGCGNSDSQCEAFEEPFADIRDLWYERRRLTERGRATDFWNRFPEDVALARDLGCGMFRFSVAWARVEPTFGIWNQSALDHYRKVAETILAAGMQPLVTLHHFTWPVHIEERGGLLADDFPSTFATYVTKVAQRLAPEVKHWITINEPNVLTFGYQKPWWERNYFQPPGLPPDAGSLEQGAAVTRLIRNLFLAHTAARNAIKLLDPTAMVGTNAANLGLPVWVQNLLDRNVINLRTPEDAAHQGRHFADRQFLEQGKVDAVVATFTKTDERASRIEFAEVYFLASQRVMALADSPVFTTADLPRQKIVAVATSTAEDRVRSQLPQSVLITAPHHTDAVRMLDAREVVAMVADDVKLMSIMRDAPGRYRLLDGRLGLEPYAPSVTKGNPRLLAEINTAVRTFIDSGGWADSYGRHIGKPVPDPPKLPTLATLSEIGAAGRAATVAPPPSGSPSADLLDRVRARGRIIIAVKDDVPGFGFRDAKTGELQGLEIDISRAIARHLFGSEQAVEFVPVSTAERIPALRSLLRFLDPLFRAWGLISTLATTNWWHLGMAGKLPSFLCPPECVGQIDFVGFDYYWGASTRRILRLFNLIEALVGGRFEVAPVYPQGLYNWLQKLGTMFPTLPIFIVENGCVASADGHERHEYLDKHLHEVQRAVHDGIDVRGYLYWSITTNRELGQRFSPGTDFGLHHIDLDNDTSLTRTSTRAAERYREIIKTRTVGV